MGKTVLADALGEGSEKTLAGGPVSPWKNVSVVASCLRVSGMLCVRVSQRVKSASEALSALLPYKTQSLDDASVVADTITLLDAVLSFACQHQQVRVLIPSLIGRYHLRYSALSQDVVRITIFHLPPLNSFTVEY